MQAKSEWTEHVSPEGKHYWWNQRLGESTWCKPESIVLAEVRLLINSFNSYVLFYIECSDLIEVSLVSIPKLVGIEVLCVQLQEFLASAKGWKVKLTTKGRRIYEHRSTGSSCFNLPAAVQNDFESASAAPNKTKINKEKPEELTERTNHKVKITPLANTPNCSTTSCHFATTHCELNLQVGSYSMAILVEIEDRGKLTFQGSCRFLKTLTQGTV